VRAAFALYAELKKTKISICPDSTRKGITGSEADKNSFPRSLGTRRAYAELKSAETRNSAGRNFKSATNKIPSTKRALYRGFCGTQNRREQMPLINKIMKKLPRKQVLPGELEPVRRFKEPLVKPREQQLSDEEKDENGEYPVLEREILPERIICPDCGGITLEGLDFCDKCGGELR